MITIVAAMTMTALKIRNLAMLDAGTTVLREHPRVGGSAGSSRHRSTGCIRLTLGGTLTFAVIVVWFTTSWVCVHLTQKPPHGLRAGRAFLLEAREDCNDRPQRAGRRGFAGCDHRRTADRIEVLVAISARSIAHIDETITIPQFRALVILSARGSINVKTLAGLLHVERSTTGRIVEQLITAGLIDRRPPRPCVANRSSS
jgi:hypothetical protein